MTKVTDSDSEVSVTMWHLAKAECRYSIASWDGELLGQPRLPKTLNQQLRVCLSAPGDPRRYCEGSINLKQTRRRLTSLSITSEMGECSRETAVSCRKGGVLTLRFLPRDDGLVKATKVNKGIP